MKRNALVTAGLGAMIAFGVGGFGCSSTSNGGGGTGGTVAGVGGHIGTGGTTGSQGGTTGGTDASQDTGPALAMCAPAPDDGSSCNSNPSCTKNCGPNTAGLGGRAQKPCTCSGANGTWSCPSTAGACVYPTDIDLTCLRLPSPVPPCPTTTADGGADAGSGLIRPNATACTVPSSETCGNVCGSAAAGTFSYQDSSGVGKVGYCVCIAGLFQCSSVAEWPVF